MIQRKMLAATIAYRVLNVIVVFIIHMLLSRLAGVQGYGLLSLLIANAGIFNMLSAIGADAGLTFHTASGGISPGKLLWFLARILFFQILLLIVAETFSWFLSGHFFLFKTDQLRLAWVGPVFLIAISLVEKYSALLTGRYLFSLCNKMLLAGNILMLVVLAFFFYNKTGESFEYLIMSYVILTLAQAAFLVLAYHITGKDSFSFERPVKEDHSKFFSYSLFTFFINFIQFLAYRVDYWILDHYRGEQELGWYSLAVRLAQLFWILPLLFASIIFPVTAGRKQLVDKPQLHALVRGINLLNIGAGIFLFFLAPLMIPFLFGNAYENSAVLLQILLPGVLLFCIATILAAYFAGMELLLINFYGSLLCLLVILALDLILIPSRGMKGAAMASSIGYGITCFYFIIVYCYREKISPVKFFIPQRSDLAYIRSILQAISSKK